MALNLTLSQRFSQVTLFFSIFFLFPSKKFSMVIMGITGKYLVLIGFQIILTNFWASQVINCKNLIFNGYQTSPIPLKYFFFPSKNRQNNIQSGFFLNILLFLHNSRYFFHIPFTAIQRILERKYYEKKSQIITIYFNQYFHQKVFE